MSLGIDVSENNSYVNFDALKADGVDFAIIRAGYGQGNIDSRFHEYVEAAKGAGMKIGAYWFSYALDEWQARKEGEYCRQAIDSTGQLFELPVFYDQEDSPWRNSHGYDYSIATAQCDEFSNGLGLNTGIYANLNWFYNHLDYEALKDSYPIWLAQYTNADSPDLPCAIWQYTDAGWLGGGGPYDLNTAQL